jgi:monoamine oxidase
MPDKLLPYESEPHKQVPPRALACRLNHDDYQAGRMGETETTTAHSSAHQDILLKGLPGQHDRPKKIAVVGAGMAGLVSGWLLKKAGHKVTIFESTNLVGGRVKTLRKGFSAGYYAEAGAMRIPSHHELTKFLLDQFGFLDEKWKFPNYNPNAYYYINQQHVRMSDYELNPDRIGLKFGIESYEEGKTATRLLHVCLANYIRTHELDVFKTLAAQIPPDDSRPALENESAKQRQDRERTQFRDLLHKVLNNHVAIMEIDKLSLQQFLFEKAVVEVNPDKKLSKKLSRGGADHICTVSLTDMSLSSSMAAVLRSFYNIYQAEKLYQIEKGMDQLPKAFVGDKGRKFLGNALLTDNVMYHTRVTEIFAPKEKSLGIGIKYEDPVFAERDEKLFDLVILAIPFPAIRHVRMYDVASPEKRRAFRQLHYDNACKILMEFKRAFWIKKEYGGIDGGRSITDLPIRQIFYPHSEQNDGRVLLASYTWGDESLHWTALEHETRLRFALRDLARVHSDQRDEPEERYAVEKYLRSQFVGGISHNWIEDENTAGAFAFFAPYQGSTLFPYIWRPEGRLHYCGEHTSMNPGWIEGAVESGVRAASEVWCRVELDLVDKDDGRLDVYRRSGRG